MQRNHLGQWAIALAAPLLLGAALLGTGCVDIEDVEAIDSSELDLRELDQLTPAEDEQFAIDERQPNALVELGPDDIDGQYIVQLKKGANPRAAAAAIRANPRHVYSEVFNGFAGPLNKGQVQALHRRGDVISVEADQLITIDAVQTMDGGGDPWNLDRIDQDHKNLDKRYSYNSTGKGVYVYVFDTGIRTNHSDFHDAAAVFDAFGGNGQDCHGHGTHVAGIIGGRVHGVAKQASLRSVRVVGCNGTGTWSAVLAGIEWVKHNHVKPAVVNLSIGGPKSSAVNKALDELAAAGVFISGAAGNQNRDACDYSPASAGSVFAVASADRNDKRASTSNYGPCISAYAPGVSVRSTWLDGGTRRSSGTSMAAPHIAGAAALYKSRYGDASASKIRADLRSWASKNKISSNPAKTPNLLLNTQRL